MPGAETELPPAFVVAGRVGVLGRGHKAMVDAIRKGDQVITQGGLIGKITRVRDADEVEIEIASGVKVRLVRNTIAQVLSKTEPADS